MRINLIVGQYVETYPGEYMPNVLDAWDEYTMEDNNEGYTESLRRQQALVKPGVPGNLDAVRELAITVPDDVILDLFAVPERPTLWKQVDR